MSILNERLDGTITNFGHAETSTGNAARPLDGQSYLQGATTPALAYVTIPQLLRETVSRFGPRDALVFADQGIRMSYYELDRAVDELASGLLALGLNKGDRIGIWSPNRCEWILTQFATARIGLVLVNINPAYRLTELEFALNKVGCKALICARAFKSSAYLDMVRNLCPELETCAPGQLISARLPHLRSVIVMGEDPGPGVYSFEQLRRLGGPAQQLRLPRIDKALNPDDPINIQFTSGTPARRRARHCRITTSSTTPAS